MSNPYRHPISTPVPELQGIASIASPQASDAGAVALRDQMALVLCNHIRTAHQLEAWTTLEGLPDHFWRDQRGQADALLATIPALTTPPATAAPVTDAQVEADKA